MIIYDLTCEYNHRFEGWFGSITDFENQLKDKFIACPICGSNHTRKLPTASHISTISIDSDESKEIMTAPGDRLTSQEIFSQLIEYVINHTEDEGDTYADDVRKINNQESGIHYMRGTATLEDIRDLIEEGVEILPLVLKLAGKLH